ncbi:MAG: hypothetical protein HYY06_16310 [Deltaproteobacteria bacterium]|nr:hypothetical protein [Deltaproteobacteria bacterium]
MLATTLVGCGLAACDENPPPGALDFVPLDAAVVGQADLASLGRSRFLGRILEPLEAEQDIDALGPWQVHCGVDLVRNVDRVTLTMTASGMSRSEFALVLEGRLDPDRVLGCARRRADREGRRLVVESWSGAKVVRSGERGSGVIALVPTGPVLVGYGRLVRKMLRLAESNGPSIRGDRAVVDLLTTLGARRGAGDGKGPAQARRGGAGIVVRPPPDLRAEARERLVPALRPLADAELVAAGISLGSDLALTAMARFSEQATVRRLARDARRQTDAMADDPVIALTPFARPIEALEIDSTGRDIVLGATLTERELEQIVSEIGEWLEEVRGR